MVLAREFAHAPTRPQGPTMIWLKQASISQGLGLTVWQGPSGYLEGMRQDPIAFKGV